MQAALDANFHLRVSEEAVLKTGRRMVQELAKTHVKLQFDFNLECPLEEVDLLAEVTKVAAKIPNVDLRELFVGVQLYDVNFCDGDSSIGKSRSINRHSLARAYSLAGPERLSAFKEAFGMSDSLREERAQIKIIYFAPVGGDMKAAEALTSLGTTSEATHVEVSNFADERVAYEALIAAYCKERTRVLQVTASALSRGNNGFNGEMKK